MCHKLHDSSTATKEDSRQNNQIDHFQIKRYNRSMTIYFTASLAAKDQYLEKYKKIISFLESQGHTVIAQHIIDSSESKIRMSTRAERLQFHNQLEKWLKSCDFVIAETSFPSISVGYEISLALRLARPVLVLYS